MKVHHWKDIKYSPIKIDPRMLLEEGFVVKRKCFLKGDNHVTTPSEYRYVRYDRAFIVYFLTSQLYPLMSISQESFNDLFHEVYISLTNKGNSSDAILQSDED